MLHIQFHTCFAYECQKNFTLHGFQIVYCVTTVLLRKCFETQLQSQQFYFFQQFFKWEICFSLNFLFDFVVFLKTVRDDCIVVY